MPKTEHEANLAACARACDNALQHLKSMEWCITGSLFQVSIGGDDRPWIMSLIDLVGDRITLRRAVIEQELAAIESAELQAAE